MFFSPIYLLFALPALALGMWAQFRVKSNFNKYAKIRTERNITGAQVARQLLDAYGLFDVAVERVSGNLTDHYDPRSKTLRLSDATYASPSVAAAGIAAHEMGHALQDAKNYAPLGLRSAMVPSVRIGSMLGPILFMAGYFLSSLSSLGLTVAWAGVILFGASAVFALVTLPVEFDASNRAKALLVKENILGQNEMVGVNKVLNAAALTYVAAAIQALSTLAYYAFLLMGRRD
jgi:Zn-dependent membrane protease YugP